MIFSDEFKHAEALREREEYSMSWLLCGSSDTGIMMMKTVDRY